MPRDSVRGRSNVCSTSAQSCCGAVSGQLTPAKSSLISRLINLSTSSEERYQGEYDSEEDFAEYLVNELYDLDRTMGNLSYYFDYEKYARDIFMCDYTMEDKYVFIND